MKKYRKDFLLILILLGLFQTTFPQEKNSGLDEIFKSKFELKMISSGNNFPDFDYKKDSVNFLLISLHKHIPVSVFNRKTKFSKVKTNDLLNFLERKNWAEGNGSADKATIFIADKTDGINLYKYAEPVSKEIVKEIRKALPAIKQSFSESEIAKRDAFEKWAFFLLSDVLLDSWQINNVESMFLNKQNRPYRHGMNYYIALLEQTGENESFGIYGNQYKNDNGKTICIYGNNRGITDSVTSNNRVSKEDNLLLENIARNFLPGLLNVLEKYRSYSQIVYSESGYSGEISFDEFFIWWYHFVYSQATELMRESGVLSIPDNGNFKYEME
jgi:hypothetical protein